MPSKLGAKLKNPGRQNHIFLLSDLLLIPVGILVVSEHFKSASQYAVTCLGFFLARCSQPVKNADKKRKKKRSLHIQPHYSQSSILGSKRKRKVTPSLPAFTLLTLDLIWVTSAPIKLESTCRATLRRRSPLVHPTSSRRPHPKCSIPSIRHPAHHPSRGRQLFIKHSLPTSLVEAP